MRRRFWTMGRLIGPSAACVALLWSAAPAFAQIPQPRVTEIEKRSGLLQRFDQIEPNLPPDPRRDNWYDTRWGDPPNRRKHINCYKNGGLYGLRWRDPATKSFYPYFFGSPGPGTLKERDHRAPRSLRWIGNFVHPFRPVGHYYDQGSAVPIYDLDPWVPGPGPFPFPWYYKGPMGEDLLR